MKNLFYLIFSVLLCVVSGCSDDKLAITEDTNPTKESGEFYLNINLASVDNFNTRADSDGKIDDSTGDNGSDYVTHTGYNHESTISNGRIYVFQGNNETDAICVASGELEIKTTYTLKQTGQFSTDKIPFRNIKLNVFEYDSSKTYFALAILNYDGGFVFPNLNELKKFTEWAKTEQKKTNMLRDSETTFEDPVHKKLFPMYYPTMTNATGQTGYIADSGSAFQPTTLVKIDPSDIMKSPMLETETPNTTIYVQRNVARVLLQPRLNSNNGNDLAYDDKKVGIGDIRDKGNSDKYWEAEVNISNWTLDITNETSFPVMNIENLPTEIWSTTNISEKQYFHMGNSEYERCLWAIDPNYDNSDLRESAFKRALLGETWQDARVPLYCLENTFNVDCMLRGQSTRLVMRGRWSYADKDKTDKLLGSLKDTDPCYKSIDKPYSGNENDADGPRVGFYLMGDRRKLWCRYHIEETLRAKAKEIYPNLAEDNFSIEWKNNIYGGYYTFSQLITLYEEETEISGPELDKFAMALGLKDSSTDYISYYYNCWMYYSLIIPHFDWDNVPWDEFNEIKAKPNSNNTKIADYNDNHLGRYGVVRNYSYIVSVNAIHGVGEPTIPPFNYDDTDDMPGPWYLDVDVKVMSWANHDIHLSF